MQTRAAGVEVVAELRLVHVELGTEVFRDVVAERSAEDHLVVRVAAVIRDDRSNLRIDVPVPYLITCDRDTDQHQQRRAHYPSSHLRLPVLRLSKRTSPCVEMVVAASQRLDRE